MLRTLEGGLAREHRAEPDDKLACLTALERKVLWLSTWMIHNANHIRPNRDGLKVGGHQASSASVVTLMTALYFDVLRRSFFLHADRAFQDLRHFHLLLPWQFSRFSSENLAFDRRGARAYICSESGEWEHR